MALIQWRDNYSTGISGVDHEHKELIAEINSIYDMLDKGSDKQTIIDCLGNIYGSISAHFALEERWMEQNNYDHYQAHHQDHERLLDEIVEITDEIEKTAELNADDLCQKLNDWFSIHFQTHDARLHGYANK